MLNITNNQHHALHMMDEDGMLSPGGWNNEIMLRGWNIFATEGRNKKIFLHVKAPPCHFRFIYSYIFHSYSWILKKGFVMKGKLSCLTEGRNDLLKGSSLIFEEKMKLLKVLILKGGFTMLVWTQKLIAPSGRINPKKILWLKAEIFAEQEIFNKI